jgi:hypothetical protein
MSIRRWQRGSKWPEPVTKTLAQKGRPGAFRRRISERTDQNGIKRDWHPTKGWRCREQGT